MIIGLTGGIGSGKTTVAKLFETMGCAVFNSDDNAKECYFDDEVKKLIIALLGNEAYINDFEINKKYISEKIFNDTLLLEKLDAIIHPIVNLNFKSFVTQHSFSLHIIKETALLFEKNSYHQFDATILITAPIDIKIERVMKRNSITKHEVENRMNAQLIDEQKIPLAHYVINNDGYKALIPQVIDVLSKLHN